MVWYCDHLPVFGVAPFMALRNQPYIPLYVQDYLTDEKLNRCSPATQGVYIKILCVLHKCEPYGRVLFKQMDKQVVKQNLSMMQFFVYWFADQLAFRDKVIEDAIDELIDNDVLKIEQTDFGAILYQKRMVKDFEKSQARSEAGKKGGGNPILFKQKDKQKDKQRDKQNPEYDIEYSSDTDIDIDLINKGVAIKKNEWQNLEQKKWVEDNCPTLLTMTKPLTNENLNKLIAEFGMTKVEDKLIAMENVPTLRKKYKDAYVTARSWCKKDNKDTRSTTEKLRDAEIANELNPSKVYNIYTGEYEYTNNKFNTNR